MLNTVFNLLFVACLARVSVGVESKERPRNGMIFGVLSPLFSRGNSLLLNLTETHATQAIYTVCCLVTGIASLFTVYFYDNSRNSQ